jgi:hypothetical protein
VDRQGLSTEITRAKGTYEPGHHRESLQLGKIKETATLVGKYTGYREDEQISIEIYDRPDDGQYRFTVHAYVTADPTRHGPGRGGETIEDALSTYHWNDPSRPDQHGSRT